MSDGATRDGSWATRAILDARRAIELAEIRCVSVDGLIERVSGLASDPRSAEIVLALEEATLSEEQGSVLGAAVKSLLDIIDTTRGIDRGCLDRRVGRLLFVLPDELAVPIALACVAHRRKSRRVAGLKRLGDSVDRQAYSHLVDCFDATGDARIAKAILRYPLQADCIGLGRLMDAVGDDEYWQMRVVEAALRGDRAAGLEFVDTFPHAFAWAAGRVGDPELLGTVSQCLEVAEERLAVVGIVAWAYGKLGAASELNELQSALHRLELGLHTKT